MRTAVIGPPAPVAPSRFRLDARPVIPIPTCEVCGRRLSRLSGKCNWCPRNARDRAEETPIVFLPVQHRVELACLTCSRPSPLAEARANAGRCRACGGTLVLNELP